MFIEDMTDIDYEILNFINGKESADIDEIKQKFPRIDSLEYRIRTLATPEYSGFPRTPIPNTAVLSEAYESCKDADGFTKTKYLGIFRATEIGKKAMQDQKARSKRYNKELWLKNAWIPIIVAFATTVLTNYILPKLLQMLTSSFHTL